MSTWRSSPRSSRGHNITIIQPKTSCYFKAESSLQLNLTAWTFSFSLSRHATYSFHDNKFHWQLHYEMLHFISKVSQCTPLFWLTHFPKCYPPGMNYDVHKKTNGKCNCKILSWNPFLSTMTSHNTGLYKMAVLVCSNTSKTTQFKTKSEIDQISRVLRVNRRPPN